VATLSHSKEKQRGLIVTTFSRSDKQKYSDECLVRWRLINQTVQQCVNWLNKKPQGPEREYFRRLLNEQKKILGELTRAEQRDISDGKKNLKMILAHKKLYGEKKEELIAHRARSDEQKRSKEVDDDIKSRAALGGAA